MKEEITLNSKEYESLCKVLNYMHDDELKHYEECMDSEEDTSSHIWHSILNLSLKLKEHAMMEVK